MQNTASFTLPADVVSLTREEEARIVGGIAPVLAAALIFGGTLIGVAVVAAVVGAVVYASTH